MEVSNTVIQIIGFAGVCFFIASYQIKSNRALFICQLLGCLVFFIQFMLLAAYTGAISLLVNILRNLLLLRYNKWAWVRSKYTLGAVIAILIGMTIYTWAGPLSLLPCISVAVTSIGYWTNNAQKIRASQLIGSPCTLIYDLFIRSWGGALNEMIVLISIAVSIFRYGWKEMGDPDADINK